MGGEFRQMCEQVCLPPLDDVGALLTAVQARCAAEAQQVRQGRVQAWAHWVEEVWERKPREVFAICSGKARSSPAMLKRADGSYTGNFEEMDDLLRDAWLPYFKKYAEKSEPSWD
eukprot:3975023-Karenia_brevis.AAC.1